MPGASTSAHERDSRASSRSDVIGGCASDCHPSILIRGTNRSPSRIAGPVGEASCSVAPDVEAMFELGELRDRLGLGRQQRHDDAHERTTAES